ncbi:MAG TPA: phosphoenolpyruvate synthase, partial [Candidatus Bathyarchaeia archaeon]|nr:phosphoenolpyruvate synthase [Candidatus Bathyarchaeia archaeon]
MKDKKENFENNNEKQLVWFNEIDKDDIPLVGGKGANLGEMVQAGFPVPEGFIVTSEAYFDFLAENKFHVQIKRILEPVDARDPEQLNDASQKIKKLIISGKVPLTLAKQIISFYEQLGGRFKKHCLVACRSSATAEDLPDASFAGQQETFLNVKGEANVVNKVRECWASLFTPRAIFYRQEKKFDHFKVGLAVVVQKMIQSDTSGVIFTLDPVTNDKTKIIIEAIFGLGEMIVQGLVTPDHYEVNKSDLKIIAKQVNDQQVKLIKVGTLNKKTKVPARLRRRQKITDNKIIELAGLAKKLHQHYFFPQDIEWSLEKNRTYILQTRPVTTLNQKSPVEKKKFTLNLPLIVKGDPASPGIATGYARLINSPSQINQVQYGEILVTKMTTPDFVPAMKKTVAIVTDEGGQTSHAAIVSRELGIPCVVGTKKATNLIKNGLVLTVNGATGEVFKGSPETNSLYSPSSSQFKKETSPLATNQFPSEVSVSHLKTATKLYVNLAEPDLAETIAKRNVDGVGLLRAEFMISQHIKYHPKKLIEDKKQVFFVDKLAEGIAKFCRVFDPRPVIYRATDFKTNEYGNLIGGKFFEPAEQNPMIGFRGAFRY